MKGKQYEVLKTLKCSNPLYDDLMIYRTYRLKKRTHKRTVKETAKVRDHIKRIDISIMYHLFTGDDPSLFFTFLAELTKECDSIDISEVNYFLSVPYLLNSTAKYQYKSVR